MSLILLMYSKAPAEGPYVATRHFSNVRVDGMNQKDVVEIETEDGETLFEGGENCVLPLPTPRPRAIRAIHREASGNPIMVELV